MLPSLMFRYVVHVNAEMVEMEGSLACLAIHKSLRPREIAFSTVVLLSKWYCAEKALTLRYGLARRARGCY